MKLKTWSSTSPKGYRGAHLPPHGCNRWCGFCPHRDMSFFHFRCLDLCECIAPGQRGLIFHLQGTAGYTGHSSASPPGQGAAPLGFCLSQGSGVLRVIHQFLRCDKLCGQTLCAWEKLLLASAPLTFHHRR